LNCQEEKEEKKERCPRRPSKDICMYTVAKGRRRKKNRSLERQTIKKTLHKWTPDSAKLLDAYLSVGYG
jgi:hypothetical protein